MKLGQNKKTLDVNIYAMSWANPYGEQHRIKPLPQPTRAQRLETVMRVIGHPLSIMRKWPEVQGLQNGRSETAERSDKALSMAEQKAVAAHRAALEKSIAKLSGRRDVLRAELDIVEDELKRLLLMHKAAGAVEDEPATSKKSSGKSNGKSSGKPSDIALKLAAKGTVTPASLADVTGQRPVDASNTLSRLCRDGQLKRVERGVYGAA